ncbi:adenylosuccinate synthase [Spiroplasma endosymbiont of Nephrotoma flavescens]|uniref:adenylosuccinate synthase n=1 Tax=Spiroplasma endosymbiont of Nephrotoma flavescens TaxID=3066302 RepID=UPI00313D9516
MRNTLAIIGSQWGDEGKGKISDYFAQNSAVIVRWAGGDNAGHTIVFNNEKYKLNLVPSGIFNEQAINIIANGCVINLEKLIIEIKSLQDKGFSCRNLKISNRAHIIMPYHLKIDEYQEAKRKHIIGTTKRGIGPTYENKIARVGIRICDLENPLTLKAKLENVIAIKEDILKQIYQDNLHIIVDDLLKQCQEWYAVIKQYVCDTSLLLNNLIKANQKVLFEGAQGVMLDIDHGTYPFVTSSNPSASSIAVGAGIAPWMVNNILAISKPYNTRVGSGVLITEMNAEMAHTIREVGKEYGTVSLRPRRIGWLDIVVLQHASRVNGFTSLAIMLLDVLSNIKLLKLCVAYIYKGEKINYIPADIEEYEKCQPVYMELAGWEADITKVKSWAELPENAKIYLQTISKLVDLPLALFSVGPDREQTILLTEIF